jgi:hypothetical protein
MDSHEKLIFENEKNRAQIFPRRAHISALHSTAAATRSTPALLWEWGNSSHHLHWCRHGEADAAGRDEQEVEGRGRLHALASIRAPPPGEVGPRSGPTPSRSRRRRLSRSLLCQVHRASCSFPPLKGSICCWWQYRLPFWPLDGQDGPVFV